jgi:hypothetical protein
MIITIISDIRLCEQSEAVQSIVTHLWIASLHSRRRVTNLI